MKYTCISSLSLTYVSVQILKIIYMAAPLCKDFSSTAKSYSDLMKSRHPSLPRECHSVSITT